MVDVSHINLLTLISGNFKRVASSNGGTYHGPCPLCGGKDRFAIQPQAAGRGRWFCRQCHPGWGDALEWVAHRDGLDLKTREGFRTAAKELQLSLSDKPTKTKRNSSIYRAPTPKREYAAMGSTWQQHAQSFVSQCVTKLWSQAGAKALQYLIMRGVTQRVLNTESIGFNPVPYRAHWGNSPVYVPRSIIIPWFIDGMISGIRYRPPSGGYKWVSGSVGTMLYGYDSVTPGHTGLLVESELCRLILLSHGGKLVERGQVVPVATGGTSGARSSQCIARISWTERTIIALDNDEAGEAASQWWLQVLPTAQRLKPIEKDPGDMYTSGLNLSTWIESALNEGNRHA